MIPESIIKERKKTFSKRSKLVVKAGGGAGGGKDVSLVYNICDCCQESGFEAENMTCIESGQWLCPRCFGAFRAAVHRA